ncbi:hypothetical protein C8J57DRAFT_1240072, partial [Mycena rebaudengoi]
MASETPKPAEDPSAVGTEFFSAPTILSGQALAPGSLSGVATSSSNRPGPMLPRYTLHHEPDGAPFLVDVHGVRLDVSVVSTRSASSLSEGESGIPMHPLALFSGHTDGDQASSAESTLSESQAAILEGTNGLPDLALDINPDDLSPLQIDQLNAIRGVIGTANAQILASTAIMAEHQASTEDVHDTIQAMCHEFISRIDSLRDEVNAQRSRLNRCLDNNLRLVKDTGASMAQIAAAAIIPPRHPGESVESFDKRTGTVLRNKERTHVAFVGSASTAFGGGNGYPVDYEDNLPQPRENLHLAAARTRNAAQLRSILTRENTVPLNNDSASMAQRHVPVGMNNTASGYHSGTGDMIRDVGADFAAEMEVLIHTTIDHRVGHRIDLPPGNYLDEEALKWFVREVDNPRKTGGLAVEFTDVLNARVGWKPSAGPEGLYTDLTETGDSEFGDLESLCTHARQLWEIDLEIHTQREADAASQATPGTNGRPYGAKSQLPHAEPPQRANRYRDDTQQRDTRERTPQARREVVKPQANALADRSCFSCSGKDHIARGKICPNHSERAPYRERAQVAAQRVMESYSDEEEYLSEDDWGYDYQDPTVRSDEEDGDLDPNSAPDLNELLGAAEDPRVNAMRDKPRVRYFSMRIAENDDKSSYHDDTETSVINSSVSGQDSPSPGEETPPPLGGYNPGPVCIVCSHCALVVRHVPATPENGLVLNRVYSVCEHLAHVGLYPMQVDLPDSPSPPLSPLPVDTDSPIGVSEGSPAQEEFELPEGVLIPFDQPFSEDSAEAEVQFRDRLRVQSGLPPFTALEYDTNLRWVGQFLKAPPEDEEDTLARHSANVHSALRDNPVLGTSIRGQDAVLAEIQATEEITWLDSRGPNVLFTVDPAHREIVNTRAHEISLEIAYHRAQAVTLRRHLRDLQKRHDEIHRAWANEDEMTSDDRETWHKAKEQNTDNRYRLGSDMEWIRIE